MREALRKFAFAATVAVAAIAMIGAAPTTWAQDEAATKYPERDAAKSEGRGPTATFTVSPGQSIQDAIDRARPGDRVQLLPGVYHEAVTVDFDDITLIGVVENGKRAILDGENKFNDAVVASGHNFTIQGIEMRNYKANGVLVNQANNCTFRDLVGVNTGKYAIYPVQCDGVLIENCVVSDVWDAGIYAGQCKNVEIRNCTTFRNTIGIEAENSDNVLIHGNTAFNNTLGILIVLLPNLPSKSASNALVVNNWVLGNNYRNEAPAGNFAALLEPGAGIIIGAADHTEVTGNEIIGNGSMGVVVAALTDSLRDGQELGGEVVKIDVEPFSDHTYVHDNTFIDNGNGEIGQTYKSAGFVRGYDLLWTGMGVGNVWDEETTNTFPLRLPGPASTEKAAESAPATD